MVENKSSSILSSSISSHSRNPTAETESVFDLSTSSKSDEALVDSLQDLNLKKESDTSPQRISRDTENIMLSRKTKLRPKENAPSGGKVDYISDLPDEMVRLILSFLDLDSMCYFAVISKRFKDIPNDEILLIDHCMRYYSDQTKALKLRIDRWGNSYRNMIMHRPRVRLNGLYVLKTEYIKKPVRDMWTTHTPGEILKVTYYRYLRFMPGGKVRYALLYTEPKESILLLKDPYYYKLSTDRSPKNSSGRGNRFSQSHSNESFSNHSSTSNSSVPTATQWNGFVNLNGTNKKMDIYDGHFVMNRNQLTVTVPTPYCTITFELTVGHSPNSVIYKAYVPKKNKREDKDKTINLNPNNEELEIENASEEEIDADENVNDNFIPEIDVLDYCPNDMQGLTPQSAIKKNLDATEANTLKINSSEMQTSPTKFINIQTMVGIRTINISNSHLNKRIKYLYQTGGGHFNRLTLTSHYTVSRNDSEQERSYIDIRENTFVFKRVNNMYH